MPSWCSTVECSTVEYCTVCPQVGYAQLVQYSLAAAQDSLRAELARWGTEELTLYSVLNIAHCTLHKICTNFTQREYLDNNCTPENSVIYVFCLLKQSFSKKNIMFLPACYPNFFESTPCIHYFFNFLQLDKFVSKESTILQLKVNLCQTGYIQSRV